METKNLYKKKAYVDKRKWWEGFILFFVPAYSKHKMFRIKYWRGKFWICECSKKSLKRWL